ncbi:cell wall-active antibiotic response 4TMS protein YvqF [Mucilaginibacter yixingensis]|uniref:Cell wall-active antibiotic response 4TMS protein YvqF n=1 Tax=Mucilaginibacter yixingensis TaxID=1295612 RepID=A0A2T5JCE2_9SPHI|nr:LiaF domain-containing protein [Mucilaginibacter yixingensis]PTQ99430.1 cell wall-active antibiotic response 4TMS protein YvqF [Mucilaginibacter yixingensis]
MNIQENYNNNRLRNGKVFAGLIILVLGCLLLLKNLLDFFIPDWLISGHMFLLVLGLYFGVRHNFRSPVWVILTIIGGFGVLDDIVPHIHLDRAIFPMIIIAIGLWILVGRKRRWNNYENPFHDRFTKHEFTNPYQGSFNTGEPNATAEGAQQQQQQAGQAWSAGNFRTSDDYLDAVSVFGGTKKTILSKDFKGGEIVNIFGGTELDFTMADINGTVVIEVVQLFGGIKMIIPPHWQVVSDVAAVFSSVDDKRRTNVPLSTDKILVIKGTSIFAGIDIRSF